MEKSPVKKFHRITLLAALTAIIIAAPLAFTLEPPKAHAILGCLNSLKDAGKKIGDAVGGEASGLGSNVPVKDAANYRVNARTAANTRAIMNTNARLERKENCLDGLAFMAINAIIDMIGDSLVNWINSGFQGSPGFVSDPSSFFLGVGNEVAGQFIDQSGFGWLCDPFLLPNIKLALEYSYRSPFRMRAHCTPLAIAANLQAFAEGNFSEGGWVSWFQTFSTAGNPYGAYLMASLELDQRLASAIGLKQNELNWGRGFLSWRKCEQYDNIPIVGPGGEQGGGIEKRCARYGPIQTPGSVVEEQVNNGLDSGKRRIEVADEINEIFGALFNQLLKTVVNGLAGAGRSTAYNPSPRSWVSCSQASINQTCIDANGNLAIKGKDDSTRGIPGFGEPDNEFEDQRDDEFVSLNPPDLPEGTGDEQSRQTQILLFGKRARASCFETDRESAGGGQDLAIDGASQTYARINDCGEKGYWWEVELDKPESVKEIIVTTYGSEKWDLAAGATVTFYDSGGKNIFTYTVPSNTVNLSLKLTKETTGLSQVLAQKVRITNPDRMGLAEVKLFRNLPPLITLTGNPSASVPINDPFFDPGATAKDQNNTTVDVTTMVLDQNGVEAKPGDFAKTVSANGVTVFTFSKAGTYSIEYRAADSVITELVATTKRSVTVTKPVEDRRFIVN